jgi:hypothetical protein
VFFLCFVFRVSFFFLIFHTPRCTVLLFFAEKK